MSTARDLLSQSSLARRVITRPGWKSLLVEFALYSVPILLGFLMEKVHSVVEDPKEPANLVDVEVFKGEVQSILK